MRRLGVAWIAGLLALTGALSGCGAVRELINGDEPGSAEPTATATSATFRQPLELRAVTEAGSPPCATGMLAAGDGACYRVAEETLTIERAKDIRTQLDPNAGGFVVLLTLYPEDAKAFGELTRKLSQEEPPRNQLAVIVDEKVVTAPTVMSPITGGEVQIVGNFDRAAADQLVKRLTG